MPQQSIKLLWHFVYIKPCNDIGTNSSGASLSDANKTIGPSAPPMMETAGRRKSICIYFIRSSMDESGGLMIRFPVWLFSRNRTPAQSRSSSKPLAFCLLLVSCSPVLTLYTIFASMIRFASGGLYVPAFKG